VASPNLLAGSQLAGRESSTIREYVRAPAEKTIHSVSGNPGAKKRRVFSLLFQVSQSQHEVTKRPCGVLSQFGSLSLAAI
jgi:NaMN:DMB phosphoribosyltransferase